MVTKKTTWSNKNSPKFRVSKKETVSEVVTEKKLSNDSTPSVTVFTKTTTPKVVVQSEDANCCAPYVHHSQTYRIFKSICLIVLWIIILITFFLNLKIYHTINKLSNWIWLVNCDLQD